VIGEGVDTATGLVIAPNDDVWTTSQTGTVQRFRAGTTTGDPVFSLTVDSTGERGLLGLAFDPNFAANKFVYVYHTVPGASGAAPFNRVSRFTVNDTNPLDYSAVPGSETVLLTLEPLGANNHNGGGLGFGADGKLYVSVGENAVAANAQSVASRHGKLLRLNPDGSIPADNPTAIDGIAGTPAGLNRAIYAAGLRNPYRFAVHPGTGQMFINDVGAGAFEEVNAVRAGANFGWPQTEGLTPAGVNGVTYPIYAYANGTGPLQGKSIVGGAFYAPAVQAFPGEYRDDYFFADFIVGRIYRRDAGTGAVTTFAEDIGQPTDLQVTRDGRLLYLERQTGQVKAVRYVWPAAPTAVATGAGTPTQVTVTNPDGSTRFTVAPFPGFAGGASVAVDDLTGDGVADVAVGAGAGGGPHVKVFDGVSGAEVAGFFAFNPAFRGGVGVAVADTDADGVNEIIAGAGAGGGPNVKVFSRQGVELRGFFAFDASFRGGVSVAAGDLDGDRRAEIVVGAGAGGGPHVRVFRGVELTEVRSFFAYSPGFAGGVSVAVGDLDADGKAEVVTGAGAGGGPNVRVFDGVTGTKRADFFAYAPAFAGGVRVGVWNGKIVTGAGPGGGAHRRAFDPVSLQPTFEDFPFGPAFRGGIYVG
jgi:glucose/arabinose dehydrogenase